MKTAILSDIHGNMEAFMSVLKDIHQCRIKQIFCLGDCIGYGPEPQQVLDTILQLNIPTVLGNHELALLKPEYLSLFNPSAQTSLEKTRDLLKPPAIRQISDFPKYLTRSDIRMVHGYPPDLPKMYLFEASDEKLFNTFYKMTEKICFLGHTHQLEIIACDGKTIVRKPLEKGIVYLHQTHCHIINVGSVGQPRDRNNNAKYAIWDTSERSIEIRFVPYDIATTVAKIRRAGLPEHHAKRLW